MVRTIWKYAYHILAQMGKGRWLGSNKCLISQQLWDTESPLFSTEDRLQLLQVQFHEVWNQSRNFVFHGFDILLSFFPLLVHLRDTL